MRRRNQGGLVLRGTFASISTFLSAQPVRIFAASALCLSLQNHVNGILGFLHYHYTHVRLLPFLFLGCALAPLWVLVRRRWPHLLGIELWMALAVPLGYSALFFSPIDITTGLLLLFIFSISYGLLLIFLLENANLRNYGVDLLGCACGVLSMIVAAELISLEAQAAIILLGYLILALIVARRTRFRLAVLSVTVLILGLAMTVGGGRLRSFLYLHGVPDLEANEVYPTASTLLKTGRGKLVSSHHSLIARVDVVEDLSRSWVTLYFNNRPFSMAAPTYPDHLFALREIFSSAQRGLVIGVGGGSEIFGLNKAGVPDITGVEVNKAAIEAMDVVSREYGVPRLESLARLVHSEGRSFVAKQRGRQTFDVIVLKGTDLYVPQFQTSLFIESYLYTREALSDYWDLLSPDGKVIIIRPVFPRLWPASESLKLARTLREFLLSKDLDPVSHSAVFTHAIGGNDRIPKRSVFVLSRSQISQDQMRRDLEGSAAIPGYQWLSDPRQMPPQEKAGLWPSEACVREVILGQASSCEGMRIHVTTDDRPHLFLSDAKVFTRMLQANHPLQISIVIMLLSLFGYLIRLKRLGPGHMNVGMIMFSLGVIYGLIFPVFYQRLMIISPSITHTHLTVQLTYFLGSLIALWFVERLKGQVITAVLISVVAGLMAMQMEKASASRPLIQLGLWFTAIWAGLGLIFPRFFVQIHSRAAGQLPEIFGLNLLGLAVGVLLANLVGRFLGLTAVYWLLLSWLVFTTALNVVQGRRGCHAST